MNAKHLTNPVTLTIELADLRWLREFLTVARLATETDQKKAESMHTDAALRAAVAKAYGDAVAAFDQNAAVDMAYLLDRVEELQKAITVAAAELADAAVTIADRYAGNDAEALEIRLLIGDPVDKLVNIAQDTQISTKEAGE